MEFYSENNFEHNNNEQLDEDIYETYNDEQADKDIYETYNNERDDENHTKEEPRPFPNVFALFAKSLGVFSIFCAVFSIFFGSFICGGLAIILAFLSKGYGTKMEKNAKIGLLTGLIGVVLQIGILGFSVYNILYVPEFREEFYEMYEDMYGVPLDDSINDILDQLGIDDMEGEIL